MIDNGVDAKTATNPMNAGRPNTSRTG